jgi:hypothetical protein
MEDQSRVSRRERRGIARLEADVAEPLILVPELDADVHDLRGLREVGERILGGRSPSRSAEDGLLKRPFGPRDGVT